MTKIILKFLAKRGSTIFLEGVISLVGLGALALCIFLFPVLIEEMVRHSEIAFPICLFMFGMYVAAIPFFFVLYQILKILNLIDKNKISLKEFRKILGHIKYGAVAVTALCTTCMPLLYYFGEVDDAPGVILIGLS